MQPIPEPIRELSPPPADTREWLRDGVLYVTKGRWDAKWFVFVSSEADPNNRGCCKLNIEASYTDRWYWAVDSKARREEKRELRTEEQYWNDLMRGLNAWKWATTDDFRLPCDMAQDAVDLLQSASHLNDDQALIDINEEDIRRHPNPNYEDSLRVAKKSYEHYRQRYDKARKELLEAVDDIKSGARENECACTNASEN